MPYDLTVHTVPTALGAKADFTIPGRHDLDPFAALINRLGASANAGFVRASEQNAHAARNSSSDA